MTRLITYLVLFFIGFFTSFSQIKSETVLLNNEGIELPGTLTFSEENTPLLIWIHGSGGVNRDGNQPQYIKQFRDSINVNSIAFFSYDKRTANKNNIEIIKQGVLFNDFVLDAKAVINHFKKDERFTEIILIGHSQGSLIAMLASETCNKYISLAGAGETIDKTLIRQITKQSADFGKLTERYLKELKNTGEIKEVDPNLLSLFSKANQPFLLSWMNLDPIEEIKKVKIPTLIINGDKDIQVQVSDAENLKKAKQDSELAIIKNMNHVLKDIQKDEDNLKSYYSAEYSISKDLIKTIITFVKK